MKAFIVALVPVSTAFYLDPMLQKSKTRVYSTMPINDGLNSNKISFPRMDFSVKEPDMERAKECAEHFGKCSIKELKELKEGLHQKRIQEMVVGDLNKAIAVAPEEIFQERLLEEELSLQLNLLHDEMPPSYLFTSDMIPTQLEEMDDTREILEAQVKKAETNHVFEELVEDGALDSLAICALIGLLMLAPQLFLQ